MSGYKFTGAYLARVARGEITGCGENGDRVTCACDTCEAADEEIAARLEAMDAPARRKTRKPAPDPLTHDALAFPCRIVDPPGKPLPAVPLRDVDWIGLGCVEAHARLAEERGQYGVELVPYAARCLVAEIVRRRNDARCAHEALLGEIADFYAPIHRIWAGQEPETEIDVAEAALVAKVRTAIGGWCTLSLDQAALRDMARVAAMDLAAVRKIMHAVRGTPILTRHGTSGAPHLEAQARASKAIGDEVLADKVKTAWLLNSIERVLYGCDVSLGDEWYDDRETRHLLTCVASALRSGLWRHRAEGRADASVEPCCFRPHGDADSCRDRSGYSQPCRCRCHQSGRRAS